jgi:hypothetical protein
MPMVVTFEKLDGTTLSLGPFKALRFEGPQLRAVDGPSIAVHESHHWQVRGEDYLRLDCQGPLTITFLDEAGEASRQFGPYAHFSSVDGIAYRDHEVFCHLDKATQLWHVGAERRDWPVMVIAD